MAEINDIDEITDEEGERYWREDEMQAQIKAGEIATVEIWRNQAIKFEKAAEAIANSPIASEIVDIWLKKNHYLLVSEYPDRPAEKKVE